jgi:nucleoid associated protein NdpA
MLNVSTGHAARQAMAPTVPIAIASPPRGPVRVERLILHALDNHRGMLRLVDEPVLLSDEIAAFFAAYIEAAAQRADWHARFAAPDDVVPVLCRRLFDDPDDFVAASRELARRLYDQMRPRTIAPGDFLVVVYRSGDEPLQQIALLKLDPDTRLARDFTRAGGRTRVTIAAAGNLLPDSARLQKCALLTVPAAGAGFDITLLDTQAGPRADGIAAFFYRGFLGAELSPSPRRRTREFLRACDLWLSATRSRLAPADLIAFYQARRAALAAAALDLAAFTAAALPDHPHLRTDLFSHLEPLLPAEPPAPDHPAAFAIDASIAAPLVNRVTLELDGGARLSVPADRFGEMVRVQRERTAEGKYRVVVESLTLKEVTDR